MSGEQEAHHTALLGDTTQEKKTGDRTVNEVLVVMYVITGGRYGRSVVNHTDTLQYCNFAARNRHGRISWPLTQCQISHRHKGHFKFHLVASHLAKLQEGPGSDGTRGRNLKSSGLQVPLLQMSLNCPTTSFQSYRLPVPDHEAESLP
jgi:hypothetical protein